MLLISFTSIKYSVKWIWCYWTYSYVSYRPKPGSCLTKKKMNSCLPSILRARHKAKENSEIISPLHRWINWGSRNELTCPRSQCWPVSWFEHGSKSKSSAISTYYLNQAPQGWSGSFSLIASIKKDWCLISKKAQTELSSIYSASTKTGQLTWGCSLVTQLDCLQLLIQMSRPPPLKIQQPILNLRVMFYTPSI